MTYEGWANWETWNINLWIDNDYDIYKAKRFALRRTHTVTPEMVKEFVLQTWPKGTPDFKVHKGDLSLIDWSELAEHWQIEANEMNDWRGGPDEE